MMMMPMLNIAVFINKKLILISQNLVVKHALRNMLFKHVMFSVILMLIYTNRREYFLKKSNK